MEQSERQNDDVQHDELPLQWLLVELEELGAHDVLVVLVELIEIVEHLGQILTRIAEVVALAATYLDQRIVTTEGSTRIVTTEGSTRIMATATLDGPTRIEDLFLVMATRSLTS